MQKAVDGGLAEWLKASDLNSEDRASGPWVRLPRPPQMESIRMVRNSIGSGAPRKGLRVRPPRFPRQISWIVKLDGF